VDNLLLVFGGFVAQAIFGSLYVNAIGALHLRHAEKGAGLVMSPIFAVGSVLFFPAILVPFAFKGYLTGNSPKQVKDGTALSQSDLRFESFCDLMDNPLVKPGKEIASSKHRSDDAPERGGWQLAMGLLLLLMAFGASSFVQRLSAKDRAVYKDNEPQIIEFMALGSFVAGTALLVWALIAFIRNNPRRLGGNSDSSKLPPTG
jgi:hypothetical protein